MFKSALFLISFLFVLINGQFDQSQPIPQTYDGLLIYGSQSASQNYFLLEAFYDLLDPDSASSFNLLNNVIQQKNLSNQHNFNMIVHLFPMPININSYPLSIGMRYIHEQFGQGLATEYMKYIFNQQSKFWYTGMLSQQGVENSLASLINSQSQFSQKFNQTQFQIALQNSNFDGDLRISWKYACSRNVFEAPTYFINGILLNNAEGFDQEDWETIFSQFFTF